MRRDGLSKMLTSHHYHHHLSIHYFITLLTHIRHPSILSTRVKKRVGKERYFNKGMLLLIVTHKVKLLMIPCL